MVLLGSCRKAIVCEQIEMGKLRPLVYSDINFQFMRCRISCLDFNSWDSLPMNKCKGFSEVDPEIISMNLPIEACDKIAGFSVEDVAREIKPKIKKLNAIKNDVCEE